MPWKMKKVGDVDVLDTGSDGNPVWIDTAGAEKAVAGETVSRLNAEAKQHRERAEAAEAKLREYGDIDPPTARDLAAKRKDIEAGKLIESGKLEQVKAELTREYQVKIEAETKRADTAEANLKKTTIAAAFGQSPFIREKMALAPDLVQALFERSFDVRDGKLVALDANGNPMIGTGKNMGENMGFDEAMEAFVNSRPDKGSLLRGNNQNGSGVNGQGAGDGKKRTVTRSEEAKMSPADRQAFFKEVDAGTASLVDDPK